MCMSESAIPKKCQQRQQKALIFFCAIFSTVIHAHQKPASLVPVPKSVAILRTCLSIAKARAESWDRLASQADAADDKQWDQLSCGSLQIFTSALADKSEPELTKIIQEELRAKNE